MYILFRKHHFEDENSEIEPLVASKDILKVKQFLEELLKDSINYDKEYKKFEEECKQIIEDYLKLNYENITGWRDVRAKEQTSYPITNEEKDRVIKFLKNNYYYSLGEHICNDNSFIIKYCSNLSKPYPKLPKVPTIIESYLKKEWFEIKEIKVI